MMRGALLIATLLFISGCVEHRYLYKFDLDGFCDFNYVAQGDSSDIYQPPGSFPDELFFQLKSWSEIDSSGNKVYFLEAKHRFSADSLPSSLGLREVPWTEVFLRHPAHLTPTSLFFLKIFKFEGTFNGRHRIAIEGDRWEYIPAECRILETEEDSTLDQEERRMLEEKYAAGLWVWNIERYKKRFREIIQKTLSLNPTVSVPQPWVNSALAETDSLVDAYAASAEIKSDTQELDFANLEWWANLAPEGLRILAENLNIIGDSTIQAELQRVSELLELRHQISEDLLDDTFEVRVDLPGRVIHSNTDIMEKGVLVWKFLGQDLEEENFPLEAFSIYIFPDRVVGALVLILVIFLGIKFKKGGSGPIDESGPPPPPPERIRRNSGENI